MASRGQAGTAEEHRVSVGAVAGARSRGVLGPPSMVRPSSLTWTEQKLQEMEQ